VSVPAAGAWLQVELTAPAAEAPALEAAMTAAGALAVTLGDAGDAPVLEPAPGEAPLWPVTVVTGLFPGDQDPAELEARLVGAAPGPLPPLVLRPLAEQAWERAWMDRFHPMRFGRRLWVVPSTHEPPDPEAVNLRLDPGLAFGTGTHPTTALCLQWLDGAPVAGRRVIDYGCGSGVLAIAAAKLGAREVVAVDLDPQALEATRDNAARNGVADRVRTLPADGAAPEPADLLVANILAGVLVALAPRLQGLLVPGGLLALSGVLAEQVDRVAAAYAPHLVLDPPTLRAGWALLTGHRK
jgi:ribosomal protein L11 methyltransferase